MGVCVPEEHGGAGRGLPRLRARAGGALARRRRRRRHGRRAHERVHAAAARPRRASTTCPPLAAGEELGAFALTEPGSGSDAGAMRTRAADGRHHRRQAVDHERLARGDVHRLRARGRADRAPSSCAPAPPASPWSREEEKLGLNSSSTADLAFEATPAERLGAPGEGMRIALATLDGGRIGIAAQAVGIAQAALDLATGYARERAAFGGPIARFQAIQHKLADMQTEIEAARALTWRAARLKQAGHPHTVEGAQAKLFASAVARRQTGEAIQVLGGYGYTKEFPAERYYRDAKVTEIYEGTSEIQRLVIARALLGDAMRGTPRLRPMATEERALTDLRALVPRALRAPRPSAATSFTTLSGEPVRAALHRGGPARAATQIGLPGEYPFTRGVYPSMYRGRLWTMRQFAGFGTAEETNERFRYLLDHGQTGLSHGVRHADADGPRLRQRALGGRGRARGRGDRHARRHGDAVRRDRPRRGQRVDDDQRAGGDHARVLRRRGGGARASRRSAWAARSRPTSSRSTSRRRSGASRSIRRCGCWAT